MKQSVDLSSALERLIAQIKQITTLYESAFQPDTLNAALSQMAASLKEASAFIRNHIALNFPNSFKVLLFPCVKMIFLLLLNH